MCPPAKSVELGLPGYPISCERRLFVSSSVDKITRSGWVHNPPFRGCALCGRTVQYSSKVLTLSCKRNVILPYAGGSNVGPSFLLFRQARVQSFPDKSHSVSAGCLSAALRIRGCPGAALLLQPRLC